MPYHCENCGKKIDNFILELDTELTMGVSEKRYHAQFTIDNKINSKDDNDVIIDFATLCPECYEKMFFKFIEKLGKEKVDIKTMQGYESFVHEQKGETQHAE